jgi:Protein of unknown function (DUF3592)
MSQPSRGNSTVWAFGLSMFCIFLLCGIAASLLDVWRANRAMSWPTTTGIVIESTSAPGCGRNRSGFHTLVRYQYLAGGMVHENRRILFGASSCDSQKASKAITDRFPVAASIPVRYNPQAPADAVLIAGKVDQSTWTGIYFMSFWLLLVAAATAMVISVARAERRLLPQSQPSAGPQR